MDHLDFLDKAKLEAELGAAEGGHGIGAVLVKNNEIIAAARDRTVQTNDPIAVAEMECIRAAGRRNDHSELILYSTRTPDMLVAGTLVQFGVGALAIRTTLNPSPALDCLREKNVAVLSATDGLKIHTEMYSNDIPSSLPRKSEVTQSSQSLLNEAFREARTGYEQGGVPVGAVIVRDGKILARGRNKRVQEGNPVLHGETDCLKNAGLVDNYRNVDLYTTLSPCMMCTGAVLKFGISRVVIGENKNFPGNIEYLLQRGVDVVLADDLNCKQLMARFIEEHPEIWYEDIAGREFT